MEGGDQPEERRTRIHYLHRPANKNAQAVAEKTPPHTGVADDGSIVIKNIRKGGDDGVHGGGGGGKGKHGQISRQEHDESDARARKLSKPTPQRRRPQ
mmetsp:Transcript_22656/g.44890  ORF Transcript_22656/g.44890 Transcript_22656/m.44890 type:complete len:98 (+) Transcript_22656:902-1195(+)